MNFPNLTGNYFFILNQRSRVQVLSYEITFGAECFTFQNVGLLKFELIGS